MDKKDLAYNEYNDEIDSDIIDTFLLMSGQKDIKNINIKVSNGLSAVFVSNDDTFVFQVYKLGKVSSKINSLLSNLNTDIVVYFDLGYDDLIKYEYNITKHYPLILGSYDCCIKWQKITPLNSFTKDKLFEIIKNNLVKLLWDIGKVLKGFHKNGMYHGDSRIDNIGIKDGNFVLFDFDSSNSCNSWDSITLRDFYIFITSIKFNLGDFYSEIEHKVPDNKLDFLNTLIESINCDKPIEYLDTLEIIL
jgi:hypothetical protein